MLRFLRTFATHSRPTGPTRRPTGIKRSPDVTPNASGRSGLGAGNASTPVRGNPQETKPLPSSVERKFRRPATYCAPPESVSSRPWLPPECFPGQRTLNVAIVGEPNVGKSTLVNRLLRRRVSAVSPKYNTTRNRVLGVLTEGSVQLVFYDTPGFVPEGGSQRHEYVAPLVTAACEAAEDADVVLFVVDVARTWTPDAAEALRRMTALCAETGAHLFVLANKIDLLKSDPRVEENGVAAPDLATLLSARRDPPRLDGIVSATADSDKVGVDKDATGLIAGLWRPPPAPEPAQGSASADNSADTAAAIECTPVPACTADTSATADLGSLLPADGNYGCCWHPADAEPAVVAESQDPEVLAPSSAADVIAPLASQAAQPSEARPAARGTSVAFTTIGKKIMRLLDDFEAAAYASGLVGPRGFDSLKDDEARAAKAEVPGSSASFVYRLLSPVTPICALHDSDGRIDGLRATLMRLAPERPWEYNSHVQTDASQLDQVAEAVRERLLQHLHQEVPYRIHQEHRSWHELPDGSVVVHQDLQVPSRSIAGMLLVRQGGPVKTITSEAIRTLERLWSRKVHLYLHITVKEGLRRKRAASSGTG